MCTASIPRLTSRTYEMDSANRLEAHERKTQESTFTTALHYTIIQNKENI